MAEYVISLPQAIKQVMQRQDLDDQQMSAVMQQIMTGQATDAQIGGFLIGLAMKGETVDEIAAAADRNLVRARRDGAAGGKDVILRHHQVRGKDAAVLVLDSGVDDHRVLRQRPHVVAHHDGRIDGAVRRVDTHLVHRGVGAPSVPTARAGRGTRAARNTAGGACPSS